MNTRVLAPLLPVLFLGGIAIAAILGGWVTESSKVPKKLSEGEFAGEYDPGDIRGSYTFGEIEEIFAVPASVLAQAYGFTGRDDPAAIQAKALEEIYDAQPIERDIGTDSIRWFVALYTGLPYIPEEDTGLPASAVEILRERGSVDAARWLDVERAAVEFGASVDGDAASAPATDEPPSAPAAATDAPQSAPEVETSSGTGTGTGSGNYTDDERLIKGRTTFGELLAWGVSQEQIEAVLGMPAGSRGTSMRDYFADAGVEFSLFKTGLQELVDAAR